MKQWTLVFLLLAGWARAEISPGAVAILYNSADADSKKLAEIYRLARSIPVENVIGLKMSEKSDISRAEYNQTLRDPLRDEFTKRRWWRRQADGQGLTMPIENKIRVLVSMRGVPLRIEQSPPPQAKPGEPPKPAADPIAGHDEASVDSELAMFGVDGVPTEGVLQNKFYKSEQTITDAKMPFLVLTARIDAATVKTCERMIRDAVETERTGLWGRAYVDIANKFPQGDEWLKTVVKDNVAAGIPTVVDPFTDTFPKNYPMTEASLYYGWYDWNASGPLLNPKFFFRKGAVAMHLHSFSAMQLRDPTKNWSAALLEKGAAVTVGNVYEPYLHLTHDFGILHQRLLAGFTWVEACWMAMPVTSWQGVVLGDPLYEPFRHFDNTGIKQNEDIPYRALRTAAVRWKDDPKERMDQLEKAAERMKSGVMAEAVALDYVQQNDLTAASKWFRIAKTLYPSPEDRLRQELELIGIDRQSNRKDQAVLALKNALLLNGALPEADAIRGWLDILDPPPPPAPDPTKAPPAKKP
jgi:uncharacterized protein (TIGR03790 family)